jgi:hypothetical protein
VHASNPDTWEAKAGGLQIQGQPVLNSETLSQNSPKKEKKEIFSLEKETHLP